MPGAFDVCCTYFCTGLSIFGTVGLVSLPPARAARQRLETQRAS